MAWVAIAIAMISGAHLGGWCNQCKVWMNALYGVPIPFIQNTMPHDAFEFMCWYIHFPNNKEKSQQTIQTTIHCKKCNMFWMNGWMKCERNGLWVTNFIINESMIKYAGCAITFVQFMPGKLIKHGVKFLPCVVLLLLFCLDLKFMLVLIKLVIPQMQLWDAYLKSKLDCCSWKGSVHQQLV